MTRFRSTRTILLSLLYVGGVFVAPLAAADTEQAELTIQEWSRLVWESANSGDQRSLDAYLDAIPETRHNEQADGLRAAIDQHNTNLQTARNNRAGFLIEARKLMHEHVDAGEISQALTSAVEVQTLSDDQKGILNDADMDQIVRRAKAEVPVSRREGD